MRTGALPGRGLGQRGCEFIISLGSGSCLRSCVAVVWRVGWRDAGLVRLEWRGGLSGGSCRPLAAFWRPAAALGGPLGGRWRVQADQAAYIVRQRMPRRHGAHFGQASHPHAIAAVVAHARVNPDGSATPRRKASDTPRARGTDGPAGARCQPRRRPHTATARPGAAGRSADDRPPPRAQQPDQAAAARQTKPLSASSSIVLSLQGLNKQTK